MAATKTDFYNQDTVELAGYFKALGHPARLAILGVLARRNGCICGEIVDEIPLAQSTVSQHLKVLKEIGLVQGEVEGPAVCYGLDRRAYERMRNDAILFFNTLHSEDDEQP